MRASPMDPPLLDRVAAGQPDAIDACLRQYRGIVWSLAKKFSPNEQDAEDAVQEIFLSLWRSADRFDAQQGSEMTFVVTIARRRLIDRMRQRGRGPKIDGLDSPEVLEDEPVLDRAEVLDEAERVRGAFDRLRPEQRSVLEQTLVEGRTQQEVADATGMPLGTVKSHARRGLRRVRSLLGLDPETGERTDPDAGAT